MTLTLLQQVRESNKSFLAGAPKPIDTAGTMFAVITCIDPRLTDLLGPALGLPHARVSMIRVAGNRIDRSSRDVLRSVAVAAYVKGCEEILVVGHTDCALLTFSASQVIDRFRAAGIPRATFGEADLREWFGAFPDVRGNVVEGVAVLRSSGLLSAAVKIHGAVIDTLSGELTVVHDGDLQPGPDVPEVRGDQAGLAPVSTKAHSGEPPPAPVAPVKPARGPIVIPPDRSVASAPVVPPTSMAEAAAILGDFLAREGQNPKFHSEMAGFRALLKTERDPERILYALEKIVRGHMLQYPRVPVAVEYLLRQAGGRNASAGKTLETLHLIVDNL